MTLDGLITQLKKLRGEHAELGEAPVRVSCTDCGCWPLVEKIRPAPWNGDHTVEVVTA